MSSTYGFVVTRDHREPDNRRVREAVQVRLPGVQEQGRAEGHRRPVAGLQDGQVRLGTEADQRLTGSLLRLHVSNF